MGYFGNLEKKIQAQQLRKKGLSYSEIKKRINVETLHLPKDKLFDFLRINLQVQLADE